MENITVVSIVPMVNFVIYVLQIAGKRKGCKPMNIAKFYFHAETFVALPDELCIISEMGKYVFRHPWM